MLTYDGPVELGTVPPGSRRIRICSLNGEDMLAWKNFCLQTLLACGLANSITARTAQSVDQTQPQEGAAVAAPVKTIDQATDRVIAREHDEVATIQRFSPVIETYVQDMKPDKNMGAIPVGDHYYLGQAELASGIVDHSMLVSKNGMLSAINPISHLSSFFSSSYAPEVFLRMIYVDTTEFDRQHYEFEYVRREFLGEVRCVVFDVTPLPGSGNGRFKGRIWAEDQNFTIVRFNGVYTPLAAVNGFSLHFDSWRLNVQAGLWLPAYVFSEESGREHSVGVIRFKAQTRLWSYNLKNLGGHEEFRPIAIESVSAPLDQQFQEQDRSPLEAEREWRRQTENTVIDSLERVGLLAPPGAADKVLGTVVNNLEVTNNLDIEPDVRCRVMLTATLEMFSIGHTIVLSRGLIDVLPDEASLATMLAQELADIIVTKTSTDQWGFNDTTVVSSADALSHFSFRESPEQVQQAYQKALELLKNSPYKDKLASAGLFLKQLDADSKALPALINPRLGNHILLADQLMRSAPNLDPSKLDQIAALPIGARVKLDPWSDRVDLIKSKPVHLLSTREKMPFEITPFMPYLVRFQ